MKTSIWLTPSCLSRKKKNWAPKKNALSKFLLRPWHQIWAIFKFKSASLCGHHSPQKHYNLKIISRRYLIKSDRQRDMNKAAQWEISAHPRVPGGARTALASKGITIVGRIKLVVIRDDFTSLRKQHSPTRQGITFIQALHKIRKEVDFSLKVSTSASNIKWIMGTWPVMKPSERKQKARVASLSSYWPLIIRESVLDWTPNSKNLRWCL